MRLPPLLQRPAQQVIRGVLCACVLTTLPATVHGQSSVSASLTDLLTAQGPAPPGFVRDLPAAEATSASVAGLLLIELTTIPVGSSSGGFIYRLNPTLGTVERASESFGPFYTERALRSGARNLSFGISYQSSGFNTLQGTDLNSGTFPTNISRDVSSLQPVSTDTLTLELDARSAAGFAHYGITDRLDVGVWIPVYNVRFSGVRQNIVAGQPSFAISASESASGLGDVAVSARYQVKQSDRLSLALGSDLKLPTGDPDNLLGAGDTSVRGLLVASLEQGRVSAHINGGVGVGGASNEIFWGTAITLAVAPQVTLVGEVLGRYFSDLNRLVQIYQPHPVLAGVETMRWLAEDGGVANSYSVAGVKWNVSGAVVLNASILAQLADGGLRARITPTISLDYAFQR